MTTNNLILTRAKITIELTSSLKKEIPEDNLVKDLDKFLSGYTYIYKEKEIKIETKDYPYYDFISIYDEICDFLKSKCELEKSSINFKLQYNNDLIGFNPVCFLLHFDEKEILKELDIDKVSKPFNINAIMPSSIDNFTSLENYIKIMFPPLTSTQYKVDISNLPEFITIKYFKGKTITDSEKVIDILSKIILNIKESINGQLKIADFEKVSRREAEINDILNKFASYSKKIDELLKSKDIKLTVNLEHDPKELEVSFPLFSNLLYKLVYVYNIKKCEFNYDSDIGSLQIKGAKLKNITFTNDIHIDIVECEIENCEMKNCTIVDCDIKDSLVDGVVKSDED